MEYSKLFSVTGIAGLFELVGSKTDGAIVRSLDDKSTKFVSSRVHNFSHLESIEVYTVRENVNLVEVFQAMDKSKAALPSDKDDKAVIAYFQKVYPDMDFDRINPLGLMYLHGDGRNKDIDKAMELLQQSAKLGNSSAQFNLGKIYRDGAKDIPADLAKAYDLFQQSAAQRNPDAENALGDFYKTGTHVTRDYKQAFSWYEKAAQQNQIDALHSLGTLYVAVMAPDKI